VTVQQIEQALYDAYGSRQVSTIYTPNNSTGSFSSCCPNTSATRRAPTAVPPVAKPVN